MGSIPYVVEDFIGIVQLFSDGSIRRSDQNLNFPMKLEDDGSAVWKDCLFDPTHNLHLRLYKPRSPPSAAAAKLPVLFFFHGGGFCVGSRDWPNSQNCCLRLASALQALVVAPDYRLAPENRLPAAFEDAMTSVKWLRDQAVAGDEEWLRGGSVDFGRVFVLGDSSGGNMAHRLAVELRRGSPEMEPVRVRGYVLMAPFFGGTVRTKSEAEGPPEKHLNLDVLDRFWRLSLPSGLTADHPWANPFGDSSPGLNPIKLDPILVLVGGCEVMKDRIENYYKELKGMGKNIECVIYEGEQHGFFLNHPFSKVAHKVLQNINEFMSKNSL